MTSPSRADGFETKFLQSGKIHWIFSTIQDFDQLPGVQLELFKFQASDSTELKRIPIAQALQFLKPSDEAIGEVPIWPRQEVDEDSYQSYVKATEGGH
jgi:hypothetical protein